MSDNEVDVLRLPLAHAGTADPASPDREIRRLARVRRGDHYGLWLMRAISDTGLLFETGVELRVGEALDVALSQTLTLSAIVVSTGEGQCRARWCDRVNSAALLRALAEEERSGWRRALRLPVVLKSLLTMRNDAKAIDLVDLSLQGAGFVFSEPLLPGMRVELLLPGDTQRRAAIIRWSAKGRGGLWFTEPLPLKMLADTAQPADMDAGGGR